jgi:hypothetical protein
MAATHVVIKRLVHAGKVYQPGELIDLTGVRTALHLMMLGYITPLAHPEPSEPAASQPAPQQSMPEPVTVTTEIPEEPSGAEDAVKPKRGRKR